MEKEKISVIVPIYKVEKYLDKCVESIVNQTYKNLEIILVDDGSPDNCPQICDEWAKKDNRIIVIHKENGGLSDARNFGIEKATGNYLMFVDSDDFLNDEIFELVERLDFDYDIIAFSHTCLLNDQKLIKSVQEYKLKNFSEVEKVSYFKNYHYTSVCFHMFKRAFLLESGLNFTTGIYYEDLDFMSRLLLRAKSICSVNINLYNFVKSRDGSITTSLKLKNMMDRIAVCDKIFKTSSEICLKKLRKVYLKHYSIYFYEVLLGFNSVKLSNNKESFDMIKQNKHLAKYSKGFRNNLINLLIRLFGIVLVENIVLLLYKIKKKGV